MNNHEELLEIFVLMGSLCSRDQKNTCADSSLLGIFKNYSVPLFINPLLFALKGAIGIRIYNM